MEQELLKRSRRAIPPALVLSLILHSTVVSVFWARPDFLFQPPPPPPPQPIPIAFVASPPRSRAESKHFEFPDSPETSEPIQSKIASDKNRKAQKRDPTRRVLPSRGGPRQPAPSRPATPQQPPAPPKPAQSNPPAEAELVPPFQAQNPYQTASAQVPQNNFQRQFERMKTGAPPSLFNPSQVAQSVNASMPEGAGGQEESQGGLLSFDTEADELGPYSRILYLKIKGAWILPQMANFAKGMTEVKFVITRAGKIENIHVSISSGWIPLDNAAVNAIRGAAPLPPLPDTFPKDRVGVTFRFYVNIPIPGE